MKQDFEFPPLSDGFKVKNNNGISPSENQILNYSAGNGNTWDSFYDGVKLVEITFI